MANPRARNGGRGRGSSRGGGGYSDRGRSSRPASSSRSGRGGGYGGGGGGGNGPLVAMIGGGAVLAIVLVVILLTRGDDGPPATGGTIPNPGPAATNRPNGPAPLVPLTADEQREIRTLIESLYPKEREAKRLAEEGMRAHQAQRYDEAQRLWHEAAAILDDMIRRSNDLFTRIGEERVAKFAANYYEATGEWPQIKMEFMKSMK